MANLLNVPGVLTFSRKENAYVREPGQVYLLGGTPAQPEFGLKKPRPTSGQIWPRSEFQRDRFIE